MKHNRVGGWKKGRPDLSDADYISIMRARCVVNERGCWIMTVGHEAKFKVDNGTPGYRWASYRGKAIPNHRLSWICHSGPNPDGHGDTAQMR